MKRFLPLALLAAAAASAAFAVVPSPQTPSPVYTGVGNVAAEGYKLISTTVVTRVSEIASITVAPCLVRIQTRGLLHDGSTTTASSALQASPQCIASDTPTVYRVNSLPWDRALIADTANGAATASVQVTPLE